MKNHTISNLSLLVPIVLVVFVTLGLGCNSQPKVNLMPSVQANENTTQNSTSIATMSFEETKQYEDEIIRLFSDSKEVTFTFECKDGSQKYVITDKDALAEFAKHFRFLKPISYDRVSNDLTPGLAISVSVGFSANPKFGFVSSLPDFHSIVFTRAHGESMVDWCDADLSVEFVLFFNYYFSNVMDNEWSLIPQTSLEDYKKDYYQWSFLEDISKSIQPLAEQN